MVCWAFLRPFAIAKASFHVLTKKFNECFDFVDWQRCCRPAIDPSIVNPCVRSLPPDHYSFFLCGGGGEANLRSLIYVKEFGRAAGISPPSDWAFGLEGAHFVKLDRPCADRPTHGTYV